MEFRLFQIVTHRSCIENPYDTWTFMQIVGVNELQRTYKCRWFDKEKNLKEETFFEAELAAK